MNLLAIDTSTEMASVAVLAHGAMHSKEQGAIRQHAKLLLPMVDDLMKVASVTFSQLDGIVFGQGPGSFTGLRIACSVAKGLAYAHDLPIYSVSSLAAIAYKAAQTMPDNPDKYDVLAVIDARMNQLYWSVYATSHFNSEEQVTDAAAISIPTPAPLILAGVGFELYEPEFAASLQQQITGRHTIYPNAEAMINLVQCGQIEAKSATDALPVYIRNKVTHGASHG